MKCVGSANDISAIGMNSDAKASPWWQYEAEGKDPYVAKDYPMTGFDRKRKGDRLGTTDAVSMDILCFHASVG